MKITIPTYISEILSIVTNKIIISKGKKFSSKWK